MNNTCALTFSNKLSYRWIKTLSLALAFKFGIYDFIMPNWYNWSYVKATSSHQ